MTWLDSLSEIRDRDWSDARPAERELKSQEVVQISAYAAAAASVVPLPFAELALLLPIHSAMVMTVGHIYGRPVSRTEASRVAVELGAVAGLTMAGTAALSALRKILLPGIGGLLAAPASFALTWGLGKIAIEYFQNPGISQERMKTVFKEAMEEAKGVFSREHLDRFRKDHGEGEAVVRAADDDAAIAEAEDPARTPPPPQAPVEEPETPPAPSSQRPKRNL